MSERTLRADARRNRDAVLVAASAAFLERGVDVPLQDIARDAGVGIGTLYRHFPHREALLVEVYRRQVEQLCAEAPALLARMPADQALETWTQQFVQHVANHRGLAEVLKDRAQRLPDPELQALFTGMHALIREAIGSLLSAGAAAGTVRADVSAADLLRAVGGLCQAFAQTGSPEQAGRLASLLVDGLRFGAA